MTYNLLQNEEETHDADKENNQLMVGVSTCGDSYDYLACY